MKKYFSILASAMAILAAASCQKDVTPDTPVPSEPTQKTFSVVLGEVETKTAITIDEATKKGKVTWTAGDKISIFDGASNVTVTLSADDIDASDASVATITATVAQADKYYAVYPASTAESFAEAVVSTLEQNGNFADVNVMAATSGADLSMSFKNVFSLVKFSTDRTDIKLVKFVGNGQEKVASQFTLAFDAEGNVSATGTADATSVCVDVNNLAGTYYIALPALTFANGFSMYLYADEAAAEPVGDVYADKELISASGKIVNLGAIDSHIGHYIRNVDELKAFLEQAAMVPSGEVWTIVNDLDMTGVEITSASSFAGVLDGADHKFLNWVVTAPLFVQTVDGSVVKNIQVDKSCSIRPVHGIFGSLVGECKGTVENCVNYADAVVNDTEYAQYIFGCLVGRSSAAVKACKNEGNLTFEYSNSTADPDTEAKTSYIGGLVGTCISPSTADKFVGCVNKGNISIKIPDSVLDGKSRIGHQYIGGIVGASAVNTGDAINMYGNIRDCHNYGDITLERPAGGINLYAQMGGICGYAQFNIYSCTNEGAISYYNSKTVGNAKPSLGGIAGTLAFNAESCTNSGAITLHGLFNNGGSNTSATALGTTYPSVGGCIGYAGTKSESIYDCVNEGKIDADIYGANSNGTTSCVAGVIGHSMSAVLVVNKCVNNGQVTAKSQTKAFHCAGVMAYQKGEIKESVNNASVTGEHDVMNNTAGASACTFNIGGIMGYNCLNVHDCSTTASSAIVAKAPSDARVGGVIGMHGQGTTAEVNLINRGTVHFEKNVDSAVRFVLGGVTGYNNVAADVTGCENYGKVTAKNSPSAALSYAGGVVGVIRGLNHTNCKNEGDIEIDGGDMTGAVYVAGCFGYNNSSATLKITDCSNSGNITVTNVKTTAWLTVGGIEGAYAKQPYITGCSNTGNLTVKCPSKMRVGGLVGGSGSTLQNSTNNCTVTVEGALASSQIGSAMGYFNGVGLNGCSFGGNLNVSNCAETAYIGAVFGATGALNGDRTWSDFVVDVNVTSDHAATSYFCGYLADSSYKLGTAEAPVKFKATTKINGVAIPAVPTMADLVGVQAPLSAGGNAEFGLVNVVVE